MIAGMNTNMWLSRSLIDGPHLALCMSQKEYKKALKALGMKKSMASDFVNEGADATVHTFDKNDGRGIACIVCLSTREDRSREQVYGILAHEATHVWQQFLDFIGEDSPGKEIEAYSIQAICQRLFEAYENDE